MWPKMEPKVDIYLHIAYFNVSLPIIIVFLTK